MRTGLLILPFLALLATAFGAVLGSSFPEIQWAGYAGIALGAAILALWVVLDLQGFKTFFGRKGTKYGASSSVVVFLGIAVIVAIAILGTRPRFNKSIDVTRDKLNTLSDQSVKIVANVAGKEDKVRIDAYFIDQDVEQTFRDLANLYQSAGAGLVIDYIDPQTDPLRAKAAEITAGNTVIVKFKGQEHRITTFTEEKFTNALVSILKEKTKKVYFTTGHGEGSPTGTEENGFSIMTEELKKNKYEVSSLSILEEAKVPEDADLVIVGGPKYDLKQEEARILEEYLARGGAMMVMVDAMTPTARLNKLMEDFGLRFKNDLLILSPEDPRAQLYGQNSAFITEFDDFSPVTRDFASQSQVSMLLSNTRSIEDVQENPREMKVELVGKTADVIVRVRDVNGPSDLGDITQERIEMGSFPAIAVASGKTQAPETASNGDANSKDEVKSDAATGSEGAALGKETRIVAVGSSQFATNAGAQLTQEHRDMFMNMASYLLADEDFISIRPKDPTKSTIDLTTSSSQLLLLMLAFIYPFLFLGGGTLHWMKRRRV